MDESIKRQFKKKLKERLEQLRIPGASVSGGRDLYKVKLAAVGYRLIYKVFETRIVVYVLSVNKREGNLAYDAASKKEINEIHLTSMWVKFQDSLF